jgi:hypothetical protein
MNNRDHRFSDIRRIVAHAIGLTPTDMATGHPSCPPTSQWRVTQNGWSDRPDAKFA